jgi:hypothetical protein
LRIMNFTPSPAHARSTTPHSPEFPSNQKGAPEIWERL